MLRRLGGSLGRWRLGQAPDAAPHLDGNLCRLWLAGARIWWLASCLLVITLLVWAHSVVWHFELPFSAACLNGNITDQPAPLLSSVAVHFIMAHVGKTQPPGYIFDSLRHMRLLNPSRIVVVVTDQEMEAAPQDIAADLSHVSTPDEFIAWRAALSSDKTPAPGIVNVLIHAVPCSKVHMAMKNVERFRELPNSAWSGPEFWYNTLARLYYAYDVLAAGGFREVIHLEFDNLLFFEYEELAAPLRAARAELTTLPLGVTTELANLVWVRSPASLLPVLEFMARPEQVRRS